MRAAAHHIRHEYSQIKFNHISIRGSLSVPALFYAKLNEYPRRDDDIQITDAIQRLDVTKVFTVHAVECAMRPMCKQTCWRGDYKRAMTYS